MNAKELFRSVLIVALWVGLGRSIALGNETDQFTFPRGIKFADVGHYYSQATFFKLAAAMEDLNNRIAQALLIHDPMERQQQLVRLHSRAEVADTIRREYPPGFFEMTAIESDLRSDRMKAMFPRDQTLIYKTWHWIYFGALLPFDPRNIPLLDQSSTIKVYGVYVGVDKFGHFHDLGHIYYKSYLHELEQGRSEQEAMHNIIEEYSKGLLSENALIGNWATGVYANGDLAANYSGFKFYRDIVDPTFVHGEVQPPMWVRDGEFWKFNKQVTPNSDFMQPFFSDHLNEALNPSCYVWEMRDHIAGRIRGEAKSILAFYTDENGKPRSKEWFDNKVIETSTYWGENYGHSRLDHVLTIGNLCFPKETEVAAKPNAQHLSAANIQHSAVNAQ